MTLLAAGCELSELATVGDGKHLRFRVGDRGRPAGSAIAFGLGSQLDRFRRPGRYDIAFRLQENTWNGTTAPQLVVRRIFETPDRYLDLHERFAAEWRAGSLSPEGEAIVAELGLVEGGPLPQPARVGHVPRAARGGAAGAGGVAVSARAGARTPGRAAGRVSGRCSSVSARRASSSCERPILREGFGPGAEGLAPRPRSTLLRWPCSKSPIDIRSTSTSCSRRSSSTSRSSTGTCSTRAFSFAAAAHDGQQRRSGEEFIEHPFGVAKILAELHLDEQTIAAALLHDVVEDTDAGPEGGQRGVRRRDRASRRRRHEADPDPVPEPRARGGGELPQADRGDGGGRARDPDQARRPAAQPAHDRVPRQAEAGAEGA